MGFFHTSKKSLESKLSGAIEICDIIVRHRTSNPNLDLSNLEKAINILKQYLEIISNGFKHRKQSVESKQTISYMITCEKLIKGNLSKEEVFTKVTRIKEGLDNLLKVLKTTSKAHDKFLNNVQQIQTLEAHNDHYSSVLNKISMIKELLNQLIKESNTSNNQELIKHRDHIRSLEIQIERIRTDLLKSKGNKTIAA